MFRWLTRNRNTKTIEIDSKELIHPVAFLGDGKYIVGCGDENSIQRWKAQDGKKEERPIYAGSLICSIAVSRDSKWIVSGTRSVVIVWDTESSKKTLELRGHRKSVFAVDISPSGTRIATGSDDHSACVWSLSTGERLLGPWKHDGDLSAVKFSLTGLLIATATWRQESIQVYDSHHGNLLVNFAIKVDSRLNETLAWSSSNNQLFALSYDGNINCLDVSSGATLSRWPVHGSNNPWCIALGSNGLFIAASNDSSVSFWDTATHEQIGSVIHHTSGIQSMVISATFDIAMAGKNKITLRSLRDILPSHYFKIALEISEPTEKFLQAQEKDSSRPHELLHLIHASDAAFALWRKDRLLEAIDVVWQEKRKLKNQRHHLFATRAFLRARLRQWGPAIIDARKSIDIQPNILAYIVLSMARFGRGNVELGKETFHRLLYKCNVAEMVSLVFLIKAIVMFTFGHREEAMVRVAGLIFNCLEHEKVVCRAVQTHMCLIEAEVCIGREEYEKALELLADLQNPQSPNDPQVSCISLMFGWSFDSDKFKFMHYQLRCEALWGLGRLNEAAILLDEVWMDLERQSVSRQEVKEWVQDFTRRFVLHRSKVQAA